MSVGLLGAPAGALGDSWAPGPTSTEQHPYGGTSVELADGTVLVAGGGADPSPEAELLASNGGSFQLAGQMIQQRLYGAATLLPSGGVLVAGGDSTLNQSSPVAKTAEIWNGAGFTATGAMQVPRQVLTLTTLPNGRALAVGGSPDFKSRAGSATAELYNPATNKWTLTGSMPSGRLGHTATLLPDCRVLIVGDDPTAVTYDYVNGRFSAAGSEGSFQRSYHTATVLANGRVLIAGGETVRGSPLKTASVWNPRTDKFTPTANSMSAPHVQGFAARLPDGRVVVGGGFSNGAFVNRVDIYNPATNRFSDAATLDPSSEVESPGAQTLQSGNVVLMGVGPSGRETRLYTPDPAGPTVSPPAQNCSNLLHPFAVRSVTPGSTGAIRYTVAAPGAGTVSVVAVAQTVPTSTPSKWFAFGSARLTLPGAGTFSLTVSPGQHARTLLHSGRKLRVSATVRFTPKSGFNVVKTVRVAVRGS